MLKRAAYLIAVTAFDIGAFAQPFVG